jgi:peptidoglycan/LPS O-acetylase OafA/YrhL
VLLVALGHASVPFLRGGFVGVDVFFVLSGFLITGILLTEARETGSVSLVAFYLRRARRILPAAALTLLTTEIAAYFLLNFLRARDVVWDSVFAATFSANFRFAEQGTDYFAHAQPPSPLLHFWSLAVEEQFYLVWPALLSVVLFGAVAIRQAARPAGKRQHRRLFLIVVLLGCLSFGWSIHLTAALPSAAYFSPATRAWELGLGAALAVGASTVARVPPSWRLAMGWSGLLAIAAGAVIFSSATPFPGYSALLPTVGAVLVISAGMTDRRQRLGAGRLLELAPMRFVGDRSYAFYLWHWPMLVIAGQYIGHELSVAFKLVLLGGAFVLSIVSYALFENPIRRAKSRVARSRVVFATSIAVVFVVAALSLNAIAQKEESFNSAAFKAEAVTASPLANYAYAPTTDSQPGRILRKVVAAVRAARAGARIPSGLIPPIGTLRNEALPYSLPHGCVPVANSSQSSSKICRLGKTTSSRSIVVIGDSHAQMWMPTILRMAQRDGWLVIPILRPGCTPDTWIDARGLAACRPWYRWATRQAKLLHPDLTLVGGAVGGSRGAAARAAENGMVAMAKAIKPASGDVIVIGDPEGLTRNPIDCLLSKHASMAVCTTTWPPALLEPYDHIAARAEVAGLGFLDTRGWFCFEYQCPTVVGRTIAYKDYHHITVAYALDLAGTFRTAVRAMIRKS